MSSSLYEIFIKYPLDNYEFFIENYEMDTINKRLIEIRRAEDLNQSQFAKRLGVDSSLINKIESGVIKITEKNIHLICLTFEVNETWFREGIGKMKENPLELTLEGERLLGFFRRLSHEARLMLIEYAEKLLSDETRLRKPASSEPSELIEKRGVG